MFYEMILFCSLAGVVGAIIGLAEINTEKARNLTGKTRRVPAAGVPHCHLAAPAPGSRNTRGSASQLRPEPSLAAGTLPEHGVPSLQRSTTKLDNCSTACSLRGSEARGKGKNST